MARAETPPARPLGRTRAGKARRSFSPRYPAWLTFPSLFYYALFFIGPLSILVLFSLAIQSGFGSVTYAFASEQFAQVIDPLYLKIFRQTLVMAAGGTALTILIGYPIAYWMARYLSTYKMLVLLLLIVPFWTSFLIRTYALQIILDPQGYVATYLNFDSLYTWKAVAIGLVYNYLPLLIIPVFASLERMDWTLVEAATDLGASPFRAFRQITLRLTMPGLVTGALLVFIPMCGEFIIPNILGGGRFQFVGTAIGDTFGQAQNWPFGAALSISLMIALSVFMIIYILFATKEERFGA